MESGDAAPWSALLKPLELERSRLAAEGGGSLVVRIHVDRGGVLRHVRLTVEKELKAAQWRLSSPGR